MKKLYFLFFLIIGFLGNAQIVNIPDASFKAQLLAANPSSSIASNEIPSPYSVNTYCSIDTNGDGEIQVVEAQNIKWLKLSNLIHRINDLTGIEYFTNLNYIDVSNNNLITIDFSQNTSLKVIIAHYNYQLTSINVNGLINLKDLFLAYCGLINLDLTSNIIIEKILCQNNPLQNIFLGQKPNLKILECDFNQLTDLNVDGAINLEILKCSNNLISYLNLNENTKLKTLWCGNNLISNLDLTQNVEVEKIWSENNQLTLLELSQNFVLNELRVYNNFIANIDISNNTNLNYLLCYNNLITNMNFKNGNSTWAQLDFSNNSNLRFICVDSGEQDYIQQIVNNSENSTFCSVNSYCTFIPGGTFYEISGNTKLDLNNNGCDISDINYPNLNFSITDGSNSGSFIANQTGNYYIPVSAGNHMITPNLENPTYFNVSPTNFTVDFPTQASPFTQDFCVTANGIKHDVEVVLIPTVPARPGFNANYKLVYRNKGNQVENGTISLNFDDTRLDYVTSNPVFNSSVVNNFTWNYTNLQPFESREIELVLNVNSPMEIPAVNNGDQLDFLAQITPFTNDEIQYDNISGLKQTVVGSYDPNDKTCLEGETIAPSEVGKYVHYVIRFENTGTYPAENIVVKDMIDLSKFDITTLVPLKSSHDFFTRISGNKVEFIFENINLDFNDSTNDGYVVFKIKTLPSLVLGDTFTNNANIYFDYNFPITTNTYTTTVAALSTQDFDFGTYFTLYPNPTKDVLNIQTKQDVAINSIEIYNQLGQIVMATTNAINSVDVASLASGTYFVKVNTEKGSANVKFVKE